MTEENGKVPKAPAEDSLAPVWTEYTVCPTCRMQVTVGESVCPHCKGIVPPPGVTSSSGEGFRYAAGNFVDRWQEFYAAHSAFVKIIVPVVAGVVLLLVLYLFRVDTSLVMEPNPSFVIEAEQKIEEKTATVTGSVRNDGPDVPDLSLLSIRVTAEFIYRDGRREKKVIFPKNQYRGEGALLTGESGAFAFSVPSEGLKEVRLKAGVVDLGTGRTLAPTAQERTKK